MSTWFRTYGFADVTEGLLIGCYPLDADDVAMLHWAGVERVLNLVEDEEYGEDEREAVERAYTETGILERRLPFPDYGRLPPRLVEAAVRIVNGWLSDGHRCYVHCRAGWQRSPAIAAALLAVRDGVGIEEALAQVRERKPSAEPLSHQVDDLWSWWRSRSDAGGATEYGATESDPRSVT